MLLSFSLTLGGIAGLTAAMSKHQRALFDRTLNGRLSAFTRIAGWLLLVASFAAAMIGWTPTVGAVAWVGLLAAAIMIAAVSVTYRPKQFLPSAFFILALALTCALASSALR